MNWNRVICLVYSMQSEYVGESLICMKIKGIVLAKVKVSNVIYLPCLTLYCGTLKERFGRM